MNDDAIILPDGTEVKLGCVMPTVQRFGAVPTWSEKNPVLPESEWEEHDDLAQFCPPIKTQHFNNCTNASIAWLAEAAFNSAESGTPIPARSMSYLYAEYNGGRDAGAMCRDVAAGFLGKGLPSAALVPESQIYRPRGGWSAEVQADAAAHVGLEIYQCENWADVGSALTRRFLVYHGFVLGQAFFGAHGDGKVPSFDGRRVNGHAMGSRGLTKKFGDMRTITPNSWGTSFGEVGVGYIDKSYFWAASGNYVNLDCYAIRAVKASGPQPPPV